MALAGANVGVAKWLAESLPIPLIAGLRCALACLVLWPLMRLTDGAPRLKPRLARNLLAQAALGTVLYNAALLAGLRWTTALEGGLVLATLPAVVALGAWALLGERPAARQLAAVALAAAAMALLVLGRPAGASEGSALGNALVLVAVCGEAAYVLLAKRIAGELPVVTASFWMQLFSALLLLPFCLPEWRSLAHLAETSILLWLVFHALTSSVLCLLLWYGGLRRAPAGIAGVFTVFLPATAAIVAVTVLGEHFTVLHGVGFGLMAASVLLAVARPRR
jgi:drug/metabolite transporter (DMT)-like permease